MKLRVLQINSLLNGGGTDDQCVKLAAGLQRAGVDVSLAGPDGREFSRVAQRLGVPFLPTGDEGFIQLRFIAKLAGLIRKHRFQIVHGHQGRDYWPTILAAWLSGRRPTIVLSRHLAKSPSSWPGRHLILGLCDALVACSEFVAHVLRDGHLDPTSPEAERHRRRPMSGDHRKIRVIYGGFELEKFQPRPSTDPAVVALRASWGVGPGDFVFGVVGGYMLPRGKGQREFLKAAALLSTRWPTARFVILGRGNMAEVLQRDIVELGLSGRAFLPGYCSDMPAAMNALDCMVHPQIGTEAMPGVVIEAHACGRPVVASALDGIPEAFAIGGLGTLVPPEDINALSAAMAQMIQQPAPSESERHAIHAKVASTMSLERYSRSMLSLYQELLAPRGNR